MRLVAVGRRARRAAAPAGAGRRRRFAVACALGLVAFAGLAPAAWGHASFLGADPAPAARLETAPRQVVLAFSEPLNRALSRADLVDARSGRRVPAARRFAGDRRLALTPRSRLARGAYRIDWQSVSTTDGHPLEGSFGFGVRVAAGAGGGSLQRSPLADGGWARALTRWALYAALLLFTGGLLARALLGRRWPAGEQAADALVSPIAGNGNGRGPTAPISPGGGVAVATRAPPRAAASPEAPDVDRAVAARADAVLADAGLAAVALAATAAALEAGLAANGLSGAALSDYLLANFAGVARIAVVGLVAVALGLARRAPRAAALAAGAAVVAVAVSGHARSANPAGVAIAADAVHLLAGAVWLGGAATIALAWGPALRERATRRRVVRTVLPRFGRVALPAFGVVAVAGVVNAIVELGRVSDLWRTSYGAILLAKVSLVALAAGAAWLHAYRLRPRLAARPGADRPYWRALRAEPLLAIGVVGAAALLVAFPLPPRQLDAASRPAGQLPACTSCPLPAVAPDELGVATQAGSQTVAAWIRRRGDALTGTVRALDFRGRPAPRAPRVLDARNAPCGPGCATFSLGGAANRLRVSVTEGGRAFVAALPARWQPASGARARRLVDRAERTMRALRSLVEDERVTSGPGTLAVARYWLRAPDRLAYRTGTGAESVEIGARQWLRTPGTPWTATRVPGDLPFRTPSWFRWTPYARSVALLGQRAGVADVALADPSTPVWVRLAIDVRRGRVLRDRLVAPARLIEHRFHSFDRPVRIVAPANAVRGD
jgi:copper transport protein